MSAIELKNWFSSHWIRQIIRNEAKLIAHDRYFWEIIVTASVVALLVIFFSYISWASPYSASTSQAPVFPVYPFIY